MCEIPKITHGERGCIITIADTNLYSVNVKVCNVNYSQLQRFANKLCDVQSLAMSS